MNYLFFDIECSNCYNNTGKICEFGYVLTDENLTTVDKGVFLINPCAEFQDYVKWRIISYKVSEYLKAPKYPDVYYSHIKRLLELPDTVYVGHGIKCDIQYLNDEAARYNLPTIDLNFADACIIYKNYHNESKPQKLKKIVKELEIGNPSSLHNSEYDSEMTLEYVKLMCNESGLSFSQLIEKYSTCKVEEKV